jgi:hypothetical protein
VRGAAPEYDVALTCFGVPVRVGAIRTWDEIVDTIPVDVTRGSRIGAGPIICTGASEDEPLDAVAAASHKQAPERELRRKALRRAEDDVALTGR